MTRLRRALAAAVLAAAASAGLAACRQAPAGDNGCPAGQYLVEVPGAGWKCAAAAGAVFVPAAFSPPPCPPATLSPAPLHGGPDCKESAP